MDAENPQIIKEYQYNKIFENGPGIANVRYLFTSLFSSILISTIGDKVIDVLTEFRSCLYSSLVNTVMNIKNCLILIINNNFNFSGILDVKRTITC